MRTLIVCLILCCWGCAVPKRAEFQPAPASQPARAVALATAPVDPPRPRTRGPASTEVPFDRPGRLALPPVMAEPPQHGAVKLTKAGARPADAPAVSQLFFATTRQAANPEDSKPNYHPRYFTREWNQGDVTYGRCTVSVPKGLPLGEVDRTLIDLGVVTIDLPDDPMKDVWMYRPKLFRGQEEFLTAVTNDLRRHKLQSLLIGVHGYNNTFEFAGRRLAKLANDMEYDGTLVLYSWPAGDSVDDYGHDTQRAAERVELDAFTDFLAVLTDRARAAGAKRIQLVAHSMGNRLVQYAAYELSRKRPGVKVLDTLVMAAPDVPVKGFVRNVWPSIQAISGQCALYISRYDQALYGSERVHADGPRLGQFGETPVVLEGLETVDAQKFDKTFMHHDYYTRDAGVRDLSALLIKGLRAEERITQGFLSRPLMPAGAGWFELAAPPILP